MIKKVTFYSDFDEQVSFIKMLLIKLLPIQFMG